MVTPVQFDLLGTKAPLSGTPVWPAEVLCGNAQVLVAPTPGTWFPTSTLYVGPMVCDYWVPSFGYSLGDYVIANEQAWSTNCRRIFVCTTAGTSGTTEPTFNQAPGATTADGAGALVWTEASTQFNAGTFTGIEPGAAGYGRASLDNSALIKFDDPVTANPIVTWPLAYNKWGRCVGILIADAASGGNVYAWGLVSHSANIAGAGASPQGPIPSMALAQGYVQTLLHSITVVNNTSTAALACAVPVSTGTVLAVLIPDFAGPVTSITDGGGGTWTRQFDIDAFQTGVFPHHCLVEYWLGTELTPGTDNITVNLPASGDIGAVFFTLDKVPTITQGNGIRTNGGQSHFAKQYPILPRSLVIVGSNSIAQFEIGNPPGGQWVILLGPKWSPSGSPLYLSRLVYRFTDDPTPDGYWPMGGGSQAVSLGAILAPGSTY